jgi:hypothetical protein
MNSYRWAIVLRFPLNKGNTWKIDRSEQEREFVVLSEGEQCVAGELKFLLSAVGTVPKQQSITPIKYPFPCEGF